MKQKIKCKIRVIVSTLRSAPEENGRASAKLIRKLKTEDLKVAGEVLAAIKTAVDLRCSPEKTELFKKAFFEEWNKH
ncbi:MAG: hypothetical protein PUA61_00290 [Succinatimonas hippei]|nr:hypothetical protein [Succinatimonas hippei]